MERCNKAKVDKQHYNHEVAQKAKEDMNKYNNFLKGSKSPKKIPSVELEDENSYEYIDFYKR